MPAAFTAKLSVQVSNFEDIGLLIQLDCLICDFCSSSQRFACGFLQIPPHDGHPCRSANDSPCRVRRRLSLPSKSALPGAPKTKKRRPAPLPRFKVDLSFLRKRFDVDKELETARLLNTKQETNVDRCSISNRSSQRDGSRRHGRIKSPSVGL